MEYTNFIDLAFKYGIWCACFLVLGIYTIKHYESLVKETKEDSRQREEALKKENNDREIRYIQTINNITNKLDNKIDVIDVKVDKIQVEVSELKKEER